MAVVYVEGFDGLLNTGLTVGAAPPFSSISNTTNVTISSTTKRTGTHALRLSSSAQYASKGGLPNAATYVAALGSPPLDAYCALDDRRSACVPVRFVVDEMVTFVVFEMDENGGAAPTVSPVLSSPSKPST